MARQRIKVSYTTTGIKQPHINTTIPKLVFLKRVANGKRKA